MDELQRLAAGRKANLDVALGQILRRLGDRHRGLVLETGVVGLGVNRHRRAFPFDAQFVQ